MKLKIFLVLLFGFLAVIAAFVAIWEMSVNNRYSREAVSAIIIFCLLAVGSTTLK